MSKESNTDIKKICQFCNSIIESKYDLLSCPKCKSTYHIECWYQNNGCVNHNCDYRIIISFYGGYGSFNIDDALINIEFLINNNRFIDAINECRRILEVDKNNLKAKEFFNKAISCINIKMKLIESGDSALTCEDLEAAELYYSRALDYADKSESDLLRTKLYVIKEKYPKLLKKRRKSKLVINSFGLILVLVLAFLVFYSLYLKEYLAYREIEQIESYGNTILMEQQVKLCENFIFNYKKGDFVNKVKAKMNTLCYYLIEDLYKKDWRGALKYLNIMDSTTNPIIYKELKEKIYNSANAEVENLLQIFNNNYSLNYFDDAKETLKVITEISRYFPESEIERRVKKLQIELNQKVRKK